MRTHGTTKAFMAGLSGLALAACSNPPAMGTDAPTPTEDVGAATICPAPIESPAAGRVFGTSVNSLFEGFTLPECDGTPYTFYDDANCPADYELTVVSIAALWCVPCQEESRQLTERISNVYGSRGVRLVQIIVDGPTRNSPFSPAQCQGWVDAYGLVNPELMDPGGAVTGAFFPDGSLPSTLIIDREGVIRFRENGATMGLVSLTAALDSLLASGG